MSALIHGAAKRFVEMIYSIVAIKTEVFLTSAYVYKEKYLQNVGVVVLKCWSPQRVIW